MVKMKNLTRSDKKRFRQIRDMKFSQDYLDEPKGKKGGKCNVTACQKPGANYYNKSTQKYYCADCAEEINWIGGRRDTMELYGVPLLCEIEE